MGAMTKPNNNVDLMRDDHLHALIGTSLLNRGEINSDPAVALICGAVFDEALKDLILAFLIESSISPKLVNHRGPLATFDAKIRMAYTLGLVDKDEFHDLDLIREIRNEFAHKLERHFEEPVIARKCRALRKKRFNLPDYELDDSPKFLLIKATLHILYNILDRTREVAEQPLSFRWRTTDPGEEKTIPTMWMKMWDPRGNFSGGA
jgi:mannitol operon repressor